MNEDWLNQYNEEEAIIRLCTQTIATLNRHDYWKKELYRERLANTEFKDMDSAEIEVAFLTHELYQINIYRMPLGCGWSSPVKKQSCESYLSDFSQLFEDYSKWCDEQRAKY